MLLYSILQASHLLVYGALNFVLHLIHLALDVGSTILNLLIDRSLVFRLPKLKLLALLIDRRQVLLTVEGKRLLRPTAKSLILRVEELWLLPYIKVVDILLILALIVRVEHSQSTLCHLALIPEIEGVIAANIDRVHCALLDEILSLSPSIFLPTPFLLFGLPCSFFLSLFCVSHKVQSGKPPIFVLVFKFFLIGDFSLFKLLPFPLEFPFDGLLLC